MKLILLTILFTLNVNADEVVFIKNDHFNSYEVVENLLANNNDLAAIQNLKRLLDSDKQNEIYILHKLSQLYAANNLTERFIALLNAKIKNAPFNAQLNHQLAKEYLISKKPVYACEKAKFMLPHVTQKENFYSILSECSLATGRPDEAVSYLDKYISHQSDLALNLKRAELHLKLNNLPLAKSDLDLYFLKAKPTEKAYLLKAELFIKQQLSEKLPELYKRCLEAIEVSPNCFLGYLKVTKVVNTNFKLDHFNQHLSAYQEHSAVVIEIGRYYQQIKNFDQAEKMYLLSFNKNPDKLETVTALFELYSQQKQSQKAFDILSRFMATTQNASNIQTAKKLQNSLFQKKSDFEMAAATTPQPSTAPTAVLSTTDSQLYLAKKYAKILSRLKNVNKKSDGEYFLLGNIYYHLNSYGNAKFHWSKVNPASILYHKAIFNSAVVMRIESMTTAANNLFNSTVFPLGMYAQTQKLAALLGEYSKRLPADEKKKVDELLKDLLYLDWEP
ncbi:MAG: hypothetical protein V4654_05730 [Bdellovibrionota bacterium]